MAPIAQHAVFTALRTAAQDFGVNALAQRMRLAPGTLYNKLSMSENTTHHKINIADLIQIVEMTGRTEPIEALCHQAGGVFVLLPSRLLLSDEALLEILNQVYAEGGDTSRIMNQAFEDGRLSRTEFHELDRQIQAWVSAILQLRERLRSIADAH